jgi:hypothetical protein
MQQFFLRCTPEREEAPGTMTTVLRSDDMRRYNRLRIIQIVRRKGAISRGEIAQEAALSPATVSTISNDLIAEGVLVARARNDAANSAGRGRPEHRSVDQSGVPPRRPAHPQDRRASTSPLSTMPATIARQEFTRHGHDRHGRIPRDS